MSQLKKQKARKLRALGLSIYDIKKQIRVSAQTINNWTKDIILTQEQVYKNNNKWDKYIYNLNIFLNPNETTYYLLGAFLAERLS